MKKQAASEVDFDGLCFSLVEMREEAKNTL